jgi:hypothetical protein
MESNPYLEARRECDERYAGLVLGTRNGRSHRLGHSNPVVMLKVYWHWFRDADTGAIDRYAQGFSGNLKTVGTGHGRESRPKSADQ